MYKKKKKNGGLKNYVRFKMTKRFSGYILYAPKYICISHIMLPIPKFILYLMEDSKTCKI